MPPVSRLCLLLIFSSLAMLAGCGGGGSHINPTPPPGGSFNASNLNGTYVFSTAGFDNISGSFLSIAGSFSANGKGGITGGIITVGGADVGGAVSSQAIGSNSSYILTADGRGQAHLTNTVLGSITLDFVLGSSAHGLITEFDANGTGSGTLDLQSTVSQGQLAGSYAFSLSGTDLSGNPLATVGSVTIDSSGNISAGVQDFNAASAASSLPISGSVVIGAAGAPGTATLTTSGTLGTLTFDVYAIDKTHLKFVERDSAAFLSGDAFTQQGAALPVTATTFAFTMAGGVTAPIAVGGVMTIDGAGSVTSGSVDVNDGGTVTSAPLNFNGSYVASGSIGGRTLINVSGFSVAAQFVAYPTASAGLLMLESDGAGLIGGAGFAQTSTAFATSQGYALGLGAANLGVGAEEDDIAEFTTTSSSLSGLIDFNDQGQTAPPGQRLSGTYQAASPPAGRYSFNSNAFNGVFYVVDSSTVLFVDLDNVLVGTGIFELQNGGAQAALASQHAVLQPRPAAHANHRQRIK